MHALALVLLVAAGQGDEKRGFGVGAGVTSDFANTQQMLSGKYFANDNWAVRFMFGLSSFSNGATVTDMRFGGGAEYHWQGTKVSPYVAGQLVFASLDSAGETTEITVFGGFGAEYWIERTLSIAGEAGLAYMKISNGADITGFATGQSSLRLTYYF